VGNLTKKGLNELAKSHLNSIYPLFCLGEGAKINQMGSNRISNWVLVSYPITDGKNTSDKNLQNT
jgi:hypothetical protein